MSNISNIDTHAVLTSNLKALGSLYLKSLSEIRRVVGPGERENCNAALEISSGGIEKG